MGRKCVCCGLQNRKQLDAAIIEGTSSARVIGEQFRVSKVCVLRHRKHVDGELQAAHSGHSLEIREVLKRFDKVIALLEAHLKKSPESPLTLDWLRELRELRVTIWARAKLRGKVSSAGESPKREGDKFIIQFVAPDGKRAEIPLSVYRALPAEVFKNGAEGSLDCQSKVPQEAGNESAT